MTADTADSLGAKAPLIVAVLAVVWVLAYWITPAPAQPEVNVSTRIAGQPTDPPPTEVLPLPGEVRTGSPMTEQPPTPLLRSEASSGDTAGTDIRNPLAGTEQVGPPSASAEPPRFRAYRVKPGETMQTIARDAYGSVELWHVVARANPRVDPNRLRVGLELRLPLDPDNIQGGPGESTSPGENASSIRTTYIVQRGDTLSEIASRIYGRSRLWTIIRDANLDAVGRDGSRLRPGQELIIPPAPAE